MSDGRVNVSGGRLAVSDGRVMVSDGRVAVSGGRVTVSGGRVAVSGGRVTVFGSSLVASDCSHLCLMVESRCLMVESWCLTAESCYIENGIYTQPVPGSCGEPSFVGMRMFSRVFLLPSGSVLQPSSRQIYLGRTIAQHFSLYHSVPHLHIAEYSCIVMAV